jgi:molybdate transport system substrate-binding protein
LKKTWLLLLALAVFPLRADKLNVAVETSLRDVAKDLAQLWADGHEDTDVELSVTSLTGLQAELAKNSSGWDVVIVPGDALIQSLAKNKLLAADSLKYPARNHLVLWGRNPLVTDEELDWDDLFEQEWRAVAVGDLEKTATGKLAQNLLEKHKLWDSLKPLVKTVPVERAALDLVRAGKVDAAFLWASDARNFKQAGWRAYALEGADVRSVLCGAGIVSGSSQATMAREFLELLVSAQARPVWGAAGFDVGGTGVNLGLRPAVSNP